MHKSIRLTNAIRSDIEDSILNHWENTNPRPDLEKVENELADHVHTKYVLPKSKTVRETLSKVPSEFLKKTDHVRVTINGEVDMLDLPEPKCRNWAASYNAPILAQFSDGDKEVQEYLKTKEALDTWQRERYQFKREVKSVLESVNSTKQLLEVWTEVEDLLPAYIADPGKAIKLPTVPVSRLNERLGIAK